VLASSVSIIVTTNRLVEIKYSWIGLHQRRQFPHSPIVIVVVARMLARLKSRWYAHYNSISSLISGLQDHIYSPFFRMAISLLQLETEYTLRRRNSKPILILFIPVAKW